MKAMCLFLNNSSAPSTLQYHSTIWSRRLVCNTRCDSFFGDGMLSSSWARRFVQIGAPAAAASQARSGASVAAAFESLAQFVQPAFKAAALVGIAFGIEAAAQFARLV